MTAPKAETGRRAALLCTSVADGTRWVQDVAPVVIPVLVPVWNTDGVRGIALTDLWWTESASHHSAFEAALRTTLPCFATSTVPRRAAHALFYAGQIRSLTALATMDAPDVPVGDQQPVAVYPAAPAVIHLLADELGRHYPDGTNRCGCGETVADGADFAQHQAIAGLAALAGDQR